jgi:minichromosome maintenance protein 10
MTTTAKKQRGPKDYDPSRQWGLRPTSSGTTTVGGEAMYIIGGHVASSSGALAPGRAAETIGREGQARAKRRAEERESESALKELLSRERASGLGGAAEVVKIARALVSAHRSQNDKGTTKEQGNKSGSASSQMKGKKKAREETSVRYVSNGNNESKSNSGLNGILGDEEDMPKRGYGAEMVKRLGFDPVSLSVKIGGRTQGQSASKKVS